jgi:hypothetical protein
MGERLSAERDAGIESKPNDWSAEGVAYLREVGKRGRGASRALWLDALDVIDSLRGDKSRLARLERERADMLALLKRLRSSASSRGLCVKLKCSRCRQRVNEDFTAISAVLARLEEGGGGK